MTTNNENTNEFKTSHYLFDAAPLLIRPELAVRIGLNEAIVLQQIHYWLENKRKSVKEKDREKDRTFQEGRFWTYDTYEQWQAQFPFWSVSTIERIFKGLSKAKILLVDNFNEWKGDRTNWYTIDYEALDKYEKPKRKSKHDKKDKDDDTQQSVNLTESGVEQSVKLTESGVEQSINLTPATPQVEEGNPSSWGEESVNMTPAIPKSSSEISSENSDLESLNSSSSLTENTSYIEEQPLNEEEEEMIKHSLIHLGYEIGKSGIMRTNRHINAILQLMKERKILVFDEVDIANAINHYKKECLERGTIHVPHDFFVNGFEMKLDERHSRTVASAERKKHESYRKRINNQYSGPVPFYNWLEQ